LGRDADKIKVVLYPLPHVAEGVVVELGHEENTSVRVGLCRSSWSTRG
jgi:hypothetical protein